MFPPGVEFFKLFGQPMVIRVILATYVTLIDLVDVIELKTSLLEPLDDTGTKYENLACIFIYCTGAMLLVPTSLFTSLERIMAEADNRTRRLAQPQTFSEVLCSCTNFFTVNVALVVARCLVVTAPSLTLTRASMALTAKNLIMIVLVVGLCKWVSKFLFFKLCNLILKQFSFNRS